MTPLGIQSRQRAQGGFTLIEALIAMLVMAFGMLAIAGLQSTLSRSSDVAKQRSEAVRLAQLKMEQLRSFDGIAAGSGTYTYTTNVVSNLVGESINAGTNTTFTRTWAVTRNDGVTAAAGTDLEKWIRVTVAWADRTGQTQNVTLNSVIGRNDPVALKGLVGGEARKKIRYPKGRDINIPYPAVSLQGGKTSAFVPPPSTVAYVFDNVTGNITQSCAADSFAISTVSRTGSTVTVNATGHTLKVGNQVMIAGVVDATYNGSFIVTSITSGVSFTYTLASTTTLASTSGTATRVIQLQEGMDLAGSGGITCTSLNAYLLSGYIRFKSGTPSASNIENTTDVPLSLMPTTATTNPLTITDSEGTPYPPASYTCYAQRQKVVSAANLLPEAIQSAVRTGGVITVTTKKNHSYVPGMLVALEFVSPASFNNSFTVASVPPSPTNSFTVVQAGADASAVVTASSQVALIQQIVVPETMNMSGTPYNNGVEARFVAYSCVVTPVVGADASKPKEWWGELKLVPTTGAGTWAIGSAASDYGVCRYSGDYIADGKTSNSEHPRFYRQVTGALDNQNFLLIAGNQNCPGDVVAAPLTGDYVNTNTVRHQGGSSSPALSYQCLTTSTPCGSKSPDLEPADPTAPTPMF